MLHYGEPSAFSLHLSARPSSDGFGVTALAPQEIFLKLRAYGFRGFFLGPEKVCLG
jgi:hypothetical protein